MERSDYSTSREQDSRVPASGYFAKIPEWLLHAVVPAKPETTDSPGQKARPVSSNAIRLYALLHRRAGRSMKCWPSRRALATEMGCSVRTVDRCVADLQMVGAIEVHPRFEEGRRERTSNLYILKERVATGLSLGGDSGGTTGGDRDVAKVATLVADKREPVNESLFERESLTSEPQERSRTRIKYEPEHLEIAKRLAAHIARNNPIAKPASDRQLASWANDVRLMIEQDERSPPEIIEVLDWCQRDSFWQANILSMGKFREKFEQLWMQKQRSGSNGNGTHSKNRNGSPEPADRFDDGTQGARIIRRRGRGS